MIPSLLPMGQITAILKLDTTINLLLVGEKLWFNQIHRKHASIWKHHPLWEKFDIPYNEFPTHSYYGDGSDIPDNVIQHIRDVMWKSAVGFQMQKGVLCKFFYLRGQSLFTAGMGQCKSQASSHPLKYSRLVPILVYVRTQTEVQ